MVDRTHHTEGLGRTSFDQGTVEVGLVAQITVYKMLDCIAVIMPVGMGCLHSLGSEQQQADEQYVPCGYGFHDILWGLNMVLITV